MQKTVLKEEVENLIEDLPEQADWDDVMYKIYVRQSIEQGLKDAKEGRTISHEEVKSYYLMSFKKLSLPVPAGSGQ
jgi:predicted transcriptional regulator